ncbi:DUF1540 domain-containing protein [Clostridium culturomicium]|uniref:DUF1540 domain-containing protein n=1 Tax=Clostridium culturomicium TaxID=1499683 RepID=UPI0038572FEC
MQKITCDVTNCSHNSLGSCYAERVNIGGEGVLAEEETCCGSFLDSRLYSTLTNCASCDKKAVELVCTANECAHNQNNLCTLDSIKVSGGPSNIYSETFCSSFEE